jgi:hypothetical protein
MPAQQAAPHSGELARNRHLAFAANQAGGHFVDRYDFPTDKPLSLGKSRARLSSGASELSGLRAQRPS